MKSSQIFDAIAAAHTAPEWATFSEVGDATGVRASRRADALAMNLWPSRGLEIRGFEIKVSRSDLKRELDDPSKAEAIGRFCNTWCLATPVGLVRAEDMIPVTWGLFEVAENGKGSFKRLPTPRPDSEVIQPSRLFVAALARAANTEICSMRTGGGWIRTESIADRIEQAYQSGIQAAPRESARKIRELEDQIKQLLPLAAELGIDMDKPNYQRELPPELALSALRAGMALFHRYGSSIIEQAVRSVDSAIDGLKQARKNLAVIQEEKDNTTKG